LPRAVNKTGYRGVRRYNDSWRRRRFYARIKYNNEAHFTPAFATPHEAAIAYDVLAKLLHGDKAILNFPAEAK